MVLHGYGIALKAYTARVKCSGHGISPSMVMFPISGDARAASPPPSIVPKVSGGRFAALHAQFATASRCSTANAEVFPCHTVANRSPVNFSGTSAITALCDEYELRYHAYT